MTPECPRLVGEDHFIHMLLWKQPNKKLVSSVFLFLVLMSPAAISLASPICLHDDYIRLMDKIVH